MLVKYGSPGEESVVDTDMVLYAVFYSTGMIDDKTHAADRLNLFLSIPVQVSILGEDAWRIWNVVLGRLGKA